MTIGSSLDSPSNSIESNLHLVRSGAPVAIGQLLKACRSYLLLVANRELDADLRAKIAPSDLVQESLLEAHRDFAQFKGTTEGEVLAWLRRILLNNVAEVRERYFETQKRNLDREVSFEHDCPPAQKNGIHRTEHSPLSNLVRREKVEELECAIAKLPEPFRQVVYLRHRDGYPFEEIGRLIGKSADAARKDWARAIERLKQILMPPETHDQD